MDKELDKNRLLSEFIKIPRAFFSPFFFGKRKVFLKL